MGWRLNLTYSACFAVFLLSAFVFLLWRDRMQKRSPLAFRQVKLFGFPCSARQVVELPRDNSDLDQVLSGGYLPGQVARDVRRTLRDVVVLIFLCVLMFVATAAMAAESFAPHQDRVFGLLAQTAMAAGVAAGLENMSIRRALDAAAEDVQRDRATPIRRWSLIKWALMALLAMVTPVLLLYSEGKTGGRVFMACVTAFLLFPFGAYCAHLLAMWWHTPGARW